MCVAAVAEVIIEALNVYYAETGDQGPFQKLPATSWRRGTLKDIRAHIFKFDDPPSHCRGTGHALMRFGIGEELPFSDLQPGDFVTLNRTNGSGHSVVFLGYLGENYAELAAFSLAVKGFKYFSAQGAKRQPPGGLGYRWAYFAPYAPEQLAGKKVDKNIVRSSDQKMLNTGCMFHPNAWTVHPPNDMPLVEGLVAEMDLETAPSDEWFQKYESYDAEEDID
jgi:hypothetical protein